MTPTPPLTHDQIVEVANSICTKHGFLLGAAIGEGSFKRVYEISNAPKIVLKLFKRPISPRDQREIEICSSGDLARVPQILHASEISYSGRDVSYIVENRLMGCSLTDYVKKNGILSSENGALLLRGLLDAAIGIWEKRLVHRDIKPDNIFVGVDLRDIYLLDLGLARHLDQVSLTQSWANRGPGTPYFSPPEQLNNEKVLIDWRADQFAIGVTVALSCLNMHPYQGEAEATFSHETVSRVENRSAIFNEKFKKLCENDGLSGLTKMCALWPVSRFCNYTKLK